MPEGTAQCFLSGKYCTQGGQVLDGAAVAGEVAAVAGEVSVTLGVLCMAATRHKSVQMPRHVRKACSLQGSTVQTQST